MGAPAARAGPTGATEAAGTFRGVEGVLIPADALARRANFAAAERVVVATGAEVGESDTEEGHQYADDGK